MGLQIEGCQLQMCNQKWSSEKKIKHLNILQISKKMVQDFQTKKHSHNFIDSKSIRKRRICRLRLSKKKKEIML